MAAHPLAGLAMLSEFERRLHQWTDRAGKEAGEFVESLQLLPVAFVKLRFVVPGIDVAGTTVGTNIQMTCFALAGKCAILGASGFNAEPLDARPALGT